MSSFIFEVFFIVLSTALASYGLMYFYLLKENNKKLYANMKDISDDLKKLHRIDKSLDELPEKFEQTVQNAQEKINQHTDQVALRIQDKIAMALDKNIEHFDQALFEFQRSKLIDQNFREDIQKLIHRKIDALADKMLQIPVENHSDTNPLEQEYQHFHQQMKHILSIMEKIDAASDHQKECLEKLNEKVQSFIDDIDGANEESKLHYIHKPEQQDTKLEDLTAIKGIGKFTQRVLNRHFNIYHLSQIAELNREQIKEIHKRIFFHGKIMREKWREQAKELLNKKKESLNPFKKSA